MIGPNIREINQVYRNMEIGIEREIYIYIDSDISELHTPDVCPEMKFDYLSCF